MYLYDRRASGDSHITEEGKYISEIFAVRVRLFIKDMDMAFGDFGWTHADNKVDLRDMENVMKAALTTVILDEIIKRRLS